MTVRNLAHGLATGTSLAFTGLCKPRYTSSVVKSTIENPGGLKMGVDLNLYYVPLFWAGERIREFKEKRKILSGFDDAVSTAFQEELLRVFPTLSLTSTVEVAEASGLYSAVSREVARALDLELANMSEAQGVIYDEVLELCRDSRITLTERSNPIPGRESIGTSIALSSSQRRKGPRLVRAAHAINEEY